MRIKLILACAFPIFLWASEKKQPNIVVMIADDCRFMDLGCYGSLDAITPHIDRLAREGMQFQSFFQATAMSSPTRQCLMTGLYPVRSGAYPNHAMANAGTKSVVHYLNSLGYHVALQGKRHIAPKETFPFDYLGAWQDVDVNLIEPFLAKTSVREEPFCLFVCSNDPHMPWTRGDQSLFQADELTLPEFIVDTPETRAGYVKYLAEINQLDSDVGKVDSLLHKYKLDENTLFIFTSEQGFTLPYAKWTCYGQGLQTAFIVRWPGVVKPGTQSDALCEYADVVPTLIDIAGGKRIEELDGESFLPVLLGNKVTHKKYVYGIQTSRGIVYGSEHYGVRTIYDGRYRYIRNLSHDEPFRCVQMRETDNIWLSWCKLAESDSFARKQVMRYVYRPVEELYDTEHDPFEMHNIADEEKYAEVKLRLSKRLERWMCQQGDLGLQTEMDALNHMVPASTQKFESTKNKIVLPCVDL